MFAGRYKKILIVGLAVIAVVLLYGMLTMPGQRSPIEKLSDTFYEL